MPINRHTTKTVVAQFIGHKKGVTIVEMLFAITILLLIAMTGGLFLYKFWHGMEMQTSAENLVVFLKGSQANAIETETVHAVFITYDGVKLVRYPNKELEQVQANLSPEEGEPISSQKFKNKVICSNIEIAGSPITVRESENDLAILINEKGEFQASTIVLAQEQERMTIKTNGKEIGVEDLNNNELPTITFDTSSLQAIQEISQEETFLVTKTEPLISNGWQTININNMDKVKEVHLRVKLDSRLLESSHLHAYVFPGKYENRNVAIASIVTGRISGLVYNADNGMGLCDATINFYKEGQLIATTLSGGNGSYSMARLSYGTYTITAHYYNQGETTTLTNIVLEEAEKTVNIPIYLFKYTIKGTVSDEYTGFPIANAKVELWVNDAFLTQTFTNNNGFYKFENVYCGSFEIKVEADNYENDMETLEIQAGSSPGTEYTVNIELEPKSQSSSLNNFSAENEGENMIPLGDWNYSLAELTTKSGAARVPVFNNPIVYILYKNKTEQVGTSLSMQEFPSAETPMYLRYTYLISGTGFSGSMTSLNSFYNTGTSYFPCGPSTFNISEQYWDGGYISSKHASSMKHTADLSGEEIEPGSYSNVLVIRTQDLPTGTTFLRIAVSLYNRQSKDCVLNYHPTNYSTNPNNVTINTSQLDYQTDPMIVIYPWLKWGNDPFWLSHYGYMLKPLNRPGSFDILATKGPIEGEDYDPYDNYIIYHPYDNYWYGPVLLDWDKILGEEGILWLIGWTSTVFEFSNWKYTQTGDTYGIFGNGKNPTHAVPSSHYWLKNFAYLSYWCLFQSSVYSPPSEIDNSSLQYGFQPKRFQEPLNLLTDNTATFFPLWERNICEPKPYESSSLSTPFLTNPKYPVWFATLPAMFNASKIFCSADLYSSYFYLMERINHIMLDTAAYIAITTENQQLKSACVGVWQVVSRGNLDKWRIEVQNIDDGLQSTYPYPRQTWWSWYTSIPWAKGIAFPIPGTGDPRIGWENPVISALPPDSNFIDWNLTPRWKTYNEILRNQPHTIYLSTAHYPLGSIEVSVKK